VSAIQWTGGAGDDSRLSGSFRNGANWSGGVVPGSSDDVLLGGTGYTVTLPYKDIYVVGLHSLTVSAGTKLLIQGEAVQGGALHETSLSVNGVITNNGTIGLSGGELFGTYVDNPSSVISGWGEILYPGTVTGTIVANGPSGEALTINGLHLAGKLGGSGAAVLEGQTEIEAGARVSVASIDIQGQLTLQADADLTRSDFSSENTHVELQGHRLLIDGGSINNDQFFYGTLVNSGKLSVSRELDLNADMVNTGTVVLEGGGHSTLDVFDRLTGKGSVILGDGAEIYDNYNGAVSAGQQINFTSNGLIDLVNGTWNSFKAKVSGLADGNRLELSNFGSSDLLEYNYKADKSGQSGVLQLHDGQNDFSLHLVGHFDAAGFSAVGDAYNNITLTYHDPAADLASSGGILYI
jgi:hypothetical protein